MVLMVTTNKEVQYMPVTSSKNFQWQKTCNLCSWLRHDIDRYKQGILVIKAINFVCVTDDDKKTLDILRPIVTLKNW